jgi:hypothetical protein
VVFLAACDPVYGKILYLGDSYPGSKNDPFLEENTVSALQLTTKYTPPKECSVYMKLFDSISLAPEEKIQMFVVCPKNHADTFANGIIEKMVAKFSPLKPDSEHYGQNLTILCATYASLDKDMNTLLKKKAHHASTIIQRKIKLD